jgi:hypothetical protein
MKLKNNGLKFLMAIALGTAAAAVAYGFGSYLTGLTGFETAYIATYPKAAAIDSCVLCHSEYPANTNKNSYANDYASAGHNFTTIEGKDSDGDGYTNIQEIKEGTFPGNALSKPIPATYTVGGTVSGLSSGTVTLQNSGGNNLILSANGGFTFTTALNNGAAYSVSILTPPAGQTCSITNGSGTIPGANVINVSVTCQALPPQTYTVGGSVSGLSSGTVTLQNSGGNNLILSANGGFTFTTALNNGAAYSVSILTPPAGQTCSITNGSGTIPGTNVINVSVTCQALPPQTYTVGGSVSGLSSGTVTLQNNGGNSLSRSANGSFNFTTALNNGAAYNVTVSQQPSGQTCSVASGSGTIPGANVINVSVTCQALPPQTYTVGGSVSGLSSGTVTLQNNGGNSLSRSANGSFNFTTALNNGAAYNVTVSQQPSGQTCSVASGSGTIANVNVTNVAVTCSSSSPDSIITITSPTLASTFTTDSGSIDIAGTTLSNAGVTGVTWADLNGGSGAAYTPDSWSSWSVHGIALRSGINVITAKAVDHAGNSSTDTLTITYNPTLGSDDDLSGMAAWAGSWLKLAIIRNGDKPSAATAFLKIDSWEQAVSTLNATIYSLSSEKGHWDGTSLPLRYISGTPRRFLFSFDYAGIIGFSGNLVANFNRNGTLVKALLGAEGLSLSTEQDGLESLDSHTAQRAHGRSFSREQDNLENDNQQDTFSIRGALIPTNQVPRQILYQ